MTSEPVRSISGARGSSAGLSARALKYSCGVYDSFFVWLRIWPLSSSSARIAV